MADYVLYHHGIKGMKWGVRRYQRKDGSRTSLGERHQLKLNRSYDDSPSPSRRKTETAKRVAKIVATKSLTSTARAAGKYYSLKRQQNGTSYVKAIGRGVDRSLTINGASLVGSLVLHAGGHHASANALGKIGKMSCKANRVLTAADLGMTAVNKFISKL